MVDHDQPVGYLLQLAEQVRRHEDRPPAVGDLADETADVLHADGVEAVVRLVEDDQFWVAEQRGGDAEALFHAHRVGAHAVVTAAGEADDLDEVGDALLRAASEYRKRTQVVDSRHGRMERRRLDERADTVEVAT